MGEIATGDRVKVDAGDSLPYWSAYLRINGLEGTVEAAQVGRVRWFGEEEDTLARVKIDGRRRRSIIPHRKLVKV